MVGANLSEYKWLECECDNITGRFLKNFTAQNCGWIYTEKGFKCGKLTKIKITIIKYFKSSKIASKIIFTMKRLHFKTETNCRTKYDIKEMHLSLNKNEDSGPPSTKSM